MRHARAILWAQFRTLRNFYARGNSGALALALVASGLWYGMILLGAVAIGTIISDPRRAALVSRNAPRMLAFLFAYWQVVPILLTSTGAGLDLKRLSVYPVTRNELFALEVLLRLSTGAEVLMILAAAALGIAANPELPVWGVLAFVPWTLMNLFLAAGLRDLIGRLLARRGMRELAVFGLVLLTALPQLLLVAGVPDAVRTFFARLDLDIWPWELTARLAFGDGSWLAALMMLLWAAAAFVFGRLQFERGFSFDAEEARATAGGPVRRPHWTELPFRWPSLLFRDPLGALLEKELRFLCRAPRFRIVFLMGFSFGLLIWLPIAFRGGGAEEGFFSANYLTFVAVYALMLLGEVSFWNAFGFDRAAAQCYFLMPVPFSRVLAAKNLAAMVFVLLEITAIAAVCRALGMPISGSKLAESYLVTGVFTVFLLAVGNLGSVYYPRPVNPAQSWKSSSAGRFQATLMLLYPLLATPIVLAYLARFAFDSQLAFYLVLGFAALLGGVLYHVALESAVEAAGKRREAIIDILSQGEGPVSV